MEKVRARLRRAAEALDVASVLDAVIDGNAAATLVSGVDPGAARHTVDVATRITRKDLPAVKLALEVAGFIDRHAAGVDMFLDGTNGRARDAVHVIFAGEK